MCALLFNSLYMGTPRQTRLVNILELVFSQPAIHPAPHFVRYSIRI